MYRGVGRSHQARDEPFYRGRVFAQDHLQRLAFFGVGATLSVGSDPPEKAIVLCVDEKPQIQATEGTAPATEEPATEGTVPATEEPATEQPAQH